MALHSVRLFVTDVDGTLLNSEKQLTGATCDAIRALERKQIQLSLVSHRPLQGLKGVLDALDLRCICVALNGGLIADREFRAISEKHLRPTIVQEIVGIIEHHHLDPWIYTRDEWYVPRLTGAHVQRESEIVDMAPIIFESLGEISGPVIKIAAVNDSDSEIQACEDRLRSQLENHLTISRPAANHLDITHREANKGTAVISLARMLGIPLTETAAAGDGENDIAMFRVAGRSIAMGQAPAEVHRAATDTTIPNSQDGLAWAIRHLILGEQGEADAGVDL